MSWLAPLKDDAMTDEQSKVFKRALSKFNIEDPAEAPAFLRILANSPSFLKDVYMNVDRGIFKDGGLQSNSKILLAAVTAAHWGNTEIASFFGDLARAAGFTDEQIYEAVGISGTSTSFNYYYKFRSLADTDAFDGISAGLRASLFMKPAMGKAFAELVNLVISTINGCSSCVSGHIQTAVEADVTREQIDEAIRTGAIVSSICQFVASSEHYGA